MNPPNLVRGNSGIPLDETLKRTAVFHPYRYVPFQTIQAALARVVIGGLLASTLVTLVLIPAVYTTGSGLLARSKADHWQARPSEIEKESAATA